LDLLLGCHPNILTLGEFHLLPWKIQRDQQRCGCGENISNCELWKPIVKEHYNTLVNGRIHRFRNSLEQGRVLRPMELWLISFRRRLSKKRDFLIRQYGQENYQVISEAIKRSRTIKDVDFVVDASKDPYRLYWLAMSGKFSVYIIHLTKDPRAFVYSTVKRNTKDLKKTVRMSLRYRIENSIIDLVQRKVACTKSIHVRYEDLAAKPGETMRRIFRNFEIDDSNYDANDFRAHINHAVAGNDMRHQNDAITLDEKWRDKLPRMKQHLVKILTHVAAKKYGYY